VARCPSVNAWLVAWRSSTTAVGVQEGPERKTGAAVGPLTCQLRNWKVGKSCSPPKRIRDALYEPALKPLACPRTRSDRRDDPGAAPAFRSAYGSTGARWLGVVLRVNEIRHWCRAAGRRDSGGHRSAEVGRIYLGDRFINMEMVADGFAWRYVIYDKPGEFTTVSSKASSSAHMAPRSTAVGSRADNSKVAESRSKVRRDRNSSIRLRETPTLRQRRSDTRPWDTFSDWRKTMHDRELREPRWSGDFRNPAAAVKPNHRLRNVAALPISPCVRTAAVSAGAAA
jgi:endonuclease YncB( thermonuclease family)